MEMLAAEWRRREAAQAAAATVAAAHIAALESKARKVTFGCRTTAQALSWSLMCSMGTRESGLFSDYIHYRPAVTYGAQALNRGQKQEADVMATQERLAAVILGQRATQIGFPYHFVRRPCRTRRGRRPTLGRTT